MTISRRNFLVGTGAAAVAGALDPAKAAPAPAPGRIDVHQHFVPDDYRSTLGASGIDSVGRVPLPAWSEAAMFDDMEQLGIARSLLSISAPGVYFGDQPFASSLAAKVNDALIDLRLRHPRRVGGLATLPLPDVEASLREWERVRAQVDGVKLLTNYDGRHLGHPHFAPLLDELARQRALVFLHPTLPPGLDQIDLALPPPILEFVFDTTRTLADMIFSGALDRYSGISWIVAHLGGTLPFVAGRLSMIEHSPRDAYAAFRERGRTVADYLRTLYFDSAVSSSQASLAAVLQITDPSHIVYGSDRPFLPMNVAKMNNHSLLSHPGLDSADQAAIAYGNMARLLAGGR